MRLHYLPTNMPEPHHGSVVMAEGPSGTAWQRFFSDGLWHSTTGRTATWADLQARAARPGAFRLLVVMLLDANGQPVETITTTDTDLGEVEELLDRIASLWPKRKTA